MDWVYFVSDGVGHIKIGKSKNVRKRIKALQTGNAHELNLILQVLFVEDAPWAVSLNVDSLEDVLHDTFKKYHVRDEWFEAEPILVFISELLTDCFIYPRRRQNSSRFITDNLIGKGRFHYEFYSLRGSNTVCCSRYLGG